MSSSPLSVELARPLEGKVATYCSDASDGGEWTTSRKVLDPGWAQLIATDGIALPASVPLPEESQHPASCTETPGVRSFVLIDSDWYGARSVTCSVLD